MDSSGYAKHFPSKQIIYVLGNHEFYRPKDSEVDRGVSRRLRLASNIHVLENDAIEIGDVIFLGTTLWTDFRLNGDVVLAEVTRADPA